MFIFFGHRAKFDTARPTARLLALWVFIIPYVQTQSNLVSNFHVILLFLLLPSDRFFSITTAGCSTFSLSLMYRPNQTESTIFYVVLLFLLLPRDHFLNARLKNRNYYSFFPGGRAVWRSGGRCQISPGVQFRPEHISYTHGGMLINLHWNVHCVKRAIHVPGWNIKVTLRGHRKTLFRCKTCTCIKEFQYNLYNLVRMFTIVWLSVPFKIQVPWANVKFTHSGQSSDENVYSDQLVIDN
jgi:hypothetical protein